MDSQPTQAQAINLDPQVLDRMRKEYERGRIANSPFPRYHGTFENFIEECLKDYMQFAWN